MWRGGSWESKRRETGRERERLKADVEGWVVGE